MIWPYPDEYGDEYGPEGEEEDDQEPHVYHREDRGLQLEQHQATGHKAFRI